jgi:molecular chaperone GrpE
MNDMNRDPREPGAAPGPADAGATPRARSAGPEEIDVPPEVIRWEDEGGIVEETSVAPGAPAEGAAPDYKDRWLRAEAELQNFRRRASREWEEGRRSAEEGVLLELVTALDDLERALEAARASGAQGAWIDGVALVAQRLRDGLARRGVTVEDPSGRPFDPAFHEALLEVDAPEGVAPGTVVQVAHKGYRRGERALRTARVVVARAPAGSAS